MKTRISTLFPNPFGGISLAILAFAGLAGPLSAAEAPDNAPRTLTVHYADLNLSSARGVEQLYSRIAAAARQVCVEPDSKSLKSSIEMRICTNQSIERAVAAVHVPALTALHAAKTGHSAPVQVAAR